jgi:PKD repeat protein
MRERHVEGAVGRTLTVLQQELQQLLLTHQGGTNTSNASSVTFSASPTSGQSPLTVTFNATRLYSDTSYTVNFGDGASGQISIPLPFCPVGSGSCSGPNFGGNVSHMYQSAGSYTATIVNSSGGTLSTATVTVSAATSQNVSFVPSPTSGTAPLSVTFTATGSQIGSGDSVTFGDGSSSGYQNVTGDSFQTSHIYQSAGTYTATLYGPLPYCPAGTSNCTRSALGTATITISAAAQSNVSFSASPTSGAVPLSVQFTASGLDVGGAPSGDTINFGDGSTALCYTAGCGVSHTYQSAGTYTAMLLSGSGGTLSTQSITVVSGNCSINGQPVQCVTAPTQIY